MDTVTDPQLAAEADVRAALHLPGAARSWGPRAHVRLPPDLAGHLRWLEQYAAALTAEAAGAGQ